MDNIELRSIIESLLFMSADPLTVSDIKKIIDGVRQPENTPPPAGETEGDVAGQIEQMQNQLKEEVSKGEIRDCLLAMVRESSDTPGRGFELVEVAKGFQYRTRPEATPFVKALYKAPSNRLSAPALETLAIVAYQQPVARSKVEEIRGVESGGVLRTLMERNLVRVVGRSEDPGRPILYGTTASFLEVFGLHALSDLPTLKDLELTDQGGAVSFPGGDEITEPSFEEAGDEADLGAEDEGSHELIEDLENSLRSLKDLERKIFEPEKTEE